MDGGKLSHMGRYTELVAKGVNFTSLSGATPGESALAHTHTCIGSAVQPPPSHTHRPHRVQTEGAGAGATAPLPTMRQVSTASAVSTASSTAGDNDALGGGDKVREGGCRASAPPVA